MNHHRVTREGQETAALYALGALSQLEACAFDAHLREGCPACDTELKEFDQVVGVLGSVAPPVAPPAYLRDLLTARIEREPVAGETLPPDSATVIPFPEQAGNPELRSTPPRSSGSGWLPWALAATLLIALGYTFTIWQRDHRALQAVTERNQNGSPEAKEIARLKQELINEAAASTELAQINSVLNATEWRIIQLVGQGPPANGSAKVFWDVQGKRWVVSTDLPPPPEGQVYQLWFVTAESKISGGLINLRTDGHGFSVVEVPPDISQIGAAAISIEPEGGSAQPTKVYLLGKA